MPTEFSLLGITFHVYGLVIGLSIILVLKIAEHHLGKSNSKHDTFWDAIIVVAVCALVGARSWHVMTDWYLYKNDWVSALYIWRGGLSIIGAIAGILAGAYFSTKFIYKKLTFFELTDVLVIGLPVGQAIGRLGNWFNQELYGLPTDLPWKIYIEPQYRLIGFQQFEYYHPLFLYEAVSLVVCASVLWWLAKQKEKFAVGKGTLTILYLAMYGWIRFFLEFLRIDKAVVGSGMLGVNQVVMLCVAVGATGYLFRKLYKGSL